MLRLNFTIIVFITCLIVSSVLAVQLFWNFLTPIVLSLVLVSIFSPLFRRLEFYFKGNKYPAALITTCVIALCVVFPIIFFTTTLSEQALELYHANKIENFVEQLQISLISPSKSIQDLIAFLNSLGFKLDTDRIAQTLTDLTQSFGLMIYDNVSAFASGAFMVLFNFIIMIVLVFTFFVAGDAVKNYFMEMFPIARDEKERLVFHFRAISQAVFVGNGIVCILEGILGGLGIYWFNLGPGIFWGVVFALSAFLPVVGTAIVFVPATILLLMENEPSLALFYFIYNVVFVAILETVVKTRLIGGKSRMNAVLVFLSVLGGVKIYGILGIFYGPLIVTMFLTLVDIYKDHYRQSTTHLPPESI